MNSNFSESIPFVDLKANYLSIKDEIDTAIQRVVSDSGFIKGPAVKQFEDSFSRYVASKFCVGCGNGTDALELILKALGIGCGDEVIVPALTWIATAEAVNNVGAQPVFADIKPDDYTISPLSIEKCISQRTKAIIVVHLYGCPCDMDEISDISKKHKIALIEDCAQSHGAEYKGRKTGSFGIASAFSFFPSKNLGAFGDAGAVITNDNDVADTVRMLANHGQLNVRNNHSIVGRNSRLDSIQAAILNVKLKYLDNWNSLRILAAERYYSILSPSSSIKLTPRINNKKHVYHLFVIRSKFRNTIHQSLTENGIACSIHYPVPLPFLEAYKYLNHSESEFPTALFSANEILSLPLFPEITESQIQKICDCVLENLNNKKHI